MTITGKLRPAERVTQAIAAALARGVLPWKKRWQESGAAAPLSLPRRANGQFYRGMNVVALWAAAEEAGFSSNQWYTFRQALERGAHVRKGERGAFVIFYKDLRRDQETETDDEPAPRTWRVLRGYIVFNRDQIDGLDPEPARACAPAEAPAGDAFAARFARIPAHVRYGGPRAYYAPVSDHVQMPPRAAFVDDPLFYATLAHELGHWTRHPSRLDRDFGQKRFGDAGYALEELVAELCAAFVGAVIGLPGDHIEDHAAYIDAWLGVLKDDPSAFVTAAGKAQVAADYLLRLMGEADTSGEPPE